MTDEQQTTWDVEFDDPTNVGIIRLTLEDETAARLSLTVNIYPGGVYESFESAAAMLTAKELRDLSLNCTMAADRLDPGGNKQVEPTPGKSAAHILLDDFEAIVTDMAATMRHWPQRDANRNLAATGLRALLDAGYVPVKDPTDEPDGAAA